MSNYRRKVRFIGVAILLLSAGSYGQTNQRTRNQRDTAEETRTDGLSDLARENLSRVAASSIQIREVLVRDSGLMVELKRWVAKEASDNGQVVEDSSLTDQAIFERLDREFKIVNRAGR